ncbi:hypothetical protein RHSIM_Rhsim06G0106500 [Rhododendron simsii]|uniref:SWIM-type domain-containing protein n=1 Tax=Rhododendron simsii TaxID=118357 RepID=A0A834LLP6_RHOSS|nr:hypothetical protein RHSIM_Rhsim06G0106500 [Rhododendron simsii]
MGTVVHDLVVHHNGQQSHIKNIDPDRYSHMELVADSCEVALTNVSERTGLALECYCFLPGSSVRMDIQNDKDLMAVFELYGMKNQKNYEHGSSSRSGKEVDTGPSLLEQMWAGLDSFDDVDWTELGDCQFNDEGDELFDYSDSEDLDWDVNGGGKSDGGHSSTDSGDGSDIDGGHQTEDREGGISNYESDDDGGQRSNDENDIQALNADRVERNAEETSTWIASKFARTLRSNPGMTIEAIYVELVENHGIAASRMQIYRGKRNALEAIEGNHAKAYHKLRQYAVEVIKTNPGSLVKLETEKIPSNVNLPTFKRMELKLHYSKLCQLQHTEGKFPGLKLRRFFWAAARAHTSLVTPMIRKRLDEVVDQSRVCKITFAGGEEYQVVEGVVSHVVNLKARTCCCKVWEISGLPCKHAASCISHKRMNVEEFCHTYYHRDT